jgi:hypothetical protein
MKGACELSKNVVFLLYGIHRFRKGIDHKREGEGPTKFLDK